MRTKILVAFLPYIVISAVHCALIIYQLPGRGFETKQLLMPALAFAVVWSMRRVRPWPRRTLLLVMIALAASWVGDGAGLFFPALPTLPMMILFFAIAHLAYIVLFWRAPDFDAVRRVPKWALAYVGWWVATLALVGPYANSLLVPLAVYGVVLGLTAALSPRLGKTVGWGGAFFLVSDTFIALKEFMGLPQIVSDLIIMPTYTLGQGLIVYGVIVLLRGRAESPVANSATSEVRF